MTCEDKLKALGFVWEPLPTISYKKDKTRALFRAKKIWTGLVHDMTALEGNSFTFPEVQTLLEGITVGGRKLSEQEQVLNTAQAWTHLFDLVEKVRFELSKEVMCSLHRHVAKGEALTTGEFRDGQVGIQGTSYMPPQWQELDAIFSQGLQEIKTLENVHERAFVFFLFGSLQQFFWDGNKRTSRLMMAGELLRHGCDIANVPASKRLEFNEKMIRFYDSREGTEMLGFLSGLLPD